MSEYNFGTYEDQISILNNNLYGYLMNDDIFVTDNGINKLVKDIRVFSGTSTSPNWSSVREAYVYDTNSPAGWKTIYRKAYRFYVEITPPSSPSEAPINIDLSTYLSALSTPWDRTLPIKGIFKINSGASIGSSNSTLPALNIPALPNNSSLVIINEGGIYGQGGRGGRGGGLDEQGIAGINGGDCIKIATQAEATKIYYTGSGILWAGGGGGGGGGYCYGNDDRNGGGGGGGGQGWRVSNGGGVGDLGNNGERNAGSGGANGGFSGPGQGGQGGRNSYGNFGGRGGNGGVWGQDGGRGMYGQPVNPDAICQPWIDYTGSCGDRVNSVNSRFGKKGGERGYAGYVINGSIISLVGINSVNGYVNTAVYKGRY